MSTPTVRRELTRRAKTPGTPEDVVGVVDRIGSVVRDALARSSNLDPALVERAVVGTLDRLTTTVKIRDAVQAAATSTPPAVLSAVADQELRWRDIQARHGLLDSGEVADLARSSARNRAGHASHLRTSGKALAVFRGGRYMFPGFQFAADGRVYPVIGKVIEVMTGQGWAPESIVEWMDSPNGYLGGRTPIERIADDAGVLNAATNAAHAGR